MLFRSIARLKKELALPSDIKQVLITNGSLIARDYVQQGLRQMAQLNGEVWFKLDRATEEGRLRTNDVRISINRVRDNLATAVSLCPTWLQTCWFKLDGEPPAQKEEDAYLDFLSGLLSDNIIPQGVLLYSLARPSLQPEAPRLNGLTAMQLEVFAARIRELGVVVKVTE